MSRTNTQSNAASARVVDEDRLVELVAGVGGLAGHHLSWTVADHKDLLGKLGSDPVL